MSNPRGRLLALAVFLILAAAQPRLARAQEKTVGGHVGFGFPWVTYDGGNVTTPGDPFRASMPVAITVNGPGRLYFDLELVPQFVDQPRDVTFTLNPGFLWKLGHGWAAGCRIGFDINSSQFGPTPLVVKSWPIRHSFFKAYFAEADFIFRFNRPVGGPSSNPFTFNTVFGLAF